MLIVHCGGSIPNLYPRLARITGAGRFGVQLFFMVSAFSLFASLKSRSSTDAKPLHAFYVRRVFRIGPLFWIAMIFYGFQHPDWRPSYAPNGIGFWHFLTTALFIHGWYPTTINGVVPGGWSIADEFMFYLLLPFLFTRIRTLAGSLQLTLVSIWVWQFVSPRVLAHLLPHFPPSWDWLIHAFVYLSFPSQFPAFCIGIVLYFLLARRGEVSDGAVPIGSSRSMRIFLLALCVFVMTSDPPDFVIYGIAFLCLAYSLAGAPIKLLVNPATRFLGTISFSAYIWHFWILSHTAGFILSLSFLHRHSAGVSSILQFGVVLFVLLACTIPVATLSYYLIELPGQEAGRRFIDLMGWGRKRGVSDSRVIAAPVQQG